MRLLMDTEIYKSLEMSTVFEENLSKVFLDDPCNWNWFFCNHTEWAKEQNLWCECVERGISLCFICGKMFSSMGYWLVGKHFKSKTQVLGTSRNFPSSDSTYLTFFPLLISSEPWVSSWYIVSYVDCSERVRFHDHYFLIFSGEEWCALSFNAGFSKNWSTGNYGAIYSFLTCQNLLFEISFNSRFKVILLVHGNFDVW